MFAGIVTDTARVKSKKAKNGSLFLTIEKPKKWKLAKGESVAVDGACLTVTDIGRGSYGVELMAETLSKTTFGKLMPERVNLERSLRLSDRVSGHFVTGHIDGTGKIEKIVPRGTSRIFFVSFPKKFGRLLAPKGSITVDGISLTLVGVSQKSFSVAVLPYTLKNTTLGKKGKGALVNLEFDILAKYAHERTIKK